MLNKILVITFIIGAFATVFVQQFNIDRLTEQNNITKQRLELEQYQSTKIEERLMESRLYNKFINAVEEISREPWSDDNNCYDHSKALQTTLKEKEIASSIFITPTRDHAFVAVWVEATTGHFIKPDRYQLGEVRDYKLNVICD